MGSDGHVRERSKVLPCRCSDITALTALCSALAVTCCISFSTYCKCPVEVSKDRRCRRPVSQVWPLLITCYTSDKLQMGRSLLIASGGTCALKHPGEGSIGAYCASRPAASRHSIPTHLQSQISGTSVLTLTSTASQRRRVLQKSRNLYCPSAKTTG